jgi:hypothetical protein
MDLVTFIDLRSHRIPNWKKHWVPSST